MDKNKIGIVILAAGDGKRMQSTTPKVMTLINGKPIIDHVVGKAESVSLDRKSTRLNSSHSRASRMPSSA